MLSENRHNRGILFIDAIFRTVRHGFVDAGGNCCDSCSDGNDIVLRMGIALRFRHEGKPFRRCAETGTFYFAFYYVYMFPTSLARFALKSHPP